MALQGKLLSGKFNGLEFNCQIDITINFTANITDIEPCKPLSTDTTNATKAVRRTVGSTEWSSDLTMQTIVDAATSTTTNASQLMQLFATGNLEGEIEVLTSSLNPEYGEAQSFIFTGPCIMSTLTVNGPEEGNSTSDVTFVSNGDWSHVQIPVTEA